MKRSELTGVNKLTANVGSDVVGLRVGFGMPFTVGLRVVGLKLGDSVGIDC